MHFCDLPLRHCETRRDLAVNSRCTRHREERYKAAFRLVCLFDASADLFTLDSLEIDKLFQSMYSLVIEVVTRYDHESCNGWRGGLCGWHVEGSRDEAPP